jgi:sugar lactone lactonase YvrE
VAGNSSYCAQFDPNNWLSPAMFGWGTTYFWNPFSPSPLDQVRGVAVHGSSVWVLDYSNYVAEFTDAGYFAPMTSTILWHGQTDFNLPSALACDASGSVYVADAGSDSPYGVRVSKFESNGQFWTTAHFGDTGTDNTKWMQSASGVAVAPNFDVYVADSQAGKVWKYHPTDAARHSFVLSAVWTSSLFDSPVGVAVGADGAVFVVDGDTKAVTKLTSSGAVLARWGGAGTANGTFTFPLGIAVGPDGHVWVGDRDAQTVQEFVLQDLGPLTYAAGTVTVKKGKTATFKYQAADDISNSVKVTIKIYKGSSLKKTISVGTVSQGAWHTKTWKCTLAKGTYTWKVYATDLTGHAQRNVAYKTFRVK